MANELGVRAMSLYNHIERKEDLLDLMFDEVAQQMVVDEPLPEDWREAITAIAQKEREILLRHPWMVDLAARRPQVGPNALKHGEQSLAAACRLDVSMKVAAHIVTAVDRYMTGYFVRERLLRDKQDGQGEGSVIESYMREMLASARFPYLARASEESVDSQESFEEGLGWLLDGIERQYGR
ncbi:TetR/AcrR family transcriptional regulator C-terminal domain-containing protein [Actinomadura sp. NBRC 104412]|uniref:TetR/AcrR family transcriptional regulator C-terminal domain-containing protein n=1 Tax=Actinomadura sp. NBRC 104412 TaxID=3032203 RepID=UPI003328D3CE